MIELMLLNVLKIRSQTQLAGAAVHCSGYLNVFVL